MSLRWTEEEYTRYTGRVLPAPVTPPAPISEGAFQAAVIRLAKQYGWLVYFTKDSRRSPSGYPDLTLAKSGQPLICAELKTETGIVSQAQQAWLEALAGCTGVVAEVWRPNALEEICRTLRG